MLGGRKKNCTVIIYFISLILVLSLLSQSNTSIDKEIEDNELEIVILNLNPSSKHDTIKQVTRQVNTTSNTRADLVTFTNVTQSLGLSGVSGNFYSWGDYNNDGNQDLMINGGRLFRNNGIPEFSFTEVTNAVGLYGNGNGAWADYDNDDFLDFYCCGSDILWHNEGPPDYKFKDVTVEGGNIRDKYPTSAVGWGDYDLDGDLDMYIANGEDWNDGNPIYYPDFLYQNNGNGTFTNSTSESGIRNFGGPYYGRGVAWGDYDDDGWPDIYISNYRISQNWLFHNNRNGTFTDLALDKGVAGEETQRMGNKYYGHTVGSAWADLDNDGDLDLFESNLAHKDLYRGPICGDSQLYRNDGKTNGYEFTNMRSGSGIQEKNIGGGEDDLFVGIAIGDFDNDGFSDLFIPQIYDLDYSYSYLYHNNGDWTFTNVSNEVGVLVWNTYGGAWCDFNNDGFLDLVTGGKGSAEQNVTSEVHLYQNNGNTNSWLQIELKGRHYNNLGIGARIKVTAPGHGILQISEVEGGMGCHSSQNSIPLEFGFGSYSDNVDVEVMWPSGYVQKLKDVELNQLIKIEETKQAPDLQIINVNIPEENPIQGETLTIEASVVNMGYFTAAQAVIQFYDGAPSTGQGGIKLGELQVITDLEKFHSDKVTIYWNTTGFSGTHNIWGVIEEVSPPELVITNNKMNSTIYIREENEKPIAVLTGTPINDLYPGDTVSFDGENSTDDISVKFYNFNFGDGNTSSWISNSRINYQYQSPGIVTATLKVKDSDGTISTNSAKVKITINSPPQPNRPPVIDRFTANPLEVETLQSVSLKVIAHDPEGDDLTYHFSAGYGELKTNEQNSGATWQAPDEKGIYLISAWVFDGELNSEIVSLEIKVIKVTKNHMPEIDEIIIEPNEIFTNTQATITVLAIDPDQDDKLQYNYDISGGTIAGSGSSVTWLAPDEPDMYFITVTVIDQGGLSDDEEIFIEVKELNYSPEVISASAEPNTLKNDDSTSVLFTVELFDENGLDDIYSVNLDLEDLNGENDQKMYDNGRYGDIHVEDGIYSYEFIVYSGLSIGTKIISITIKDRGGLEITYDVELLIEPGGTDDEASNTFTPGFEAGIIIICLAGSIIYLYYKGNKKH